MLFTNMILEKINNAIANITPDNTFDWSNISENASKYVTINLGAVDPNISASKIKGLYRAKSKEEVNTKNTNSVAIKGRLSPGKFKTFDNKCSSVAERKNERRIKISTTINN